MENITYKKLLNLLPKGAFMAIAGSLILTSCGAAYMGGYSETDGVYYDPSRDTLPSGMISQSGNGIGDYYDYQYNEDQNPYLNVENRNQNWRDSQSSDWGTYTGTDTYYTDSWSSPYGFYPSWGLGMSFGWGFGGYYSPWSIGYSPFYGYYSPYYYNPYFSYGPYGGYRSPYGYYSPYNYGYGYNSYNAPGLTYKRSGSTGGFREGNTNAGSGRYENNGLRNDTQRYNRQNNSYRQEQRSTTQPRYRTAPQSTTPRYNTPNNDQPRYRNNTDNGFRSGNTGGFNRGSSSSNNTRSSGGFRR